MEKNSDYIENYSFHEDKNTDQVIEYVKYLFTSDHENPLLPVNIKTPNRRTLVINEIGNNTDEIYDLQKYVQSLAAEMEAMKLFIKEQFIYLKNRSRKLTGVLT